MAVWTKLSAQDTKDGFGKWIAEQQQCFGELPAEGGRHVHGAGDRNLSHPLVLCRLCLGISLLFPEALCNRCAVVASGPKSRTLRHSGRGGNLVLWGSRSFEGLPSRLWLLCWTQSVSNAEYPVVCHQPCHKLCNFLRLLWSSASTNCHGGPPASFLHAVSNEPHLWEGRYGLVDKTHPSCVRPGFNTRVQH